MKIFLASSSLVVALGVVWAASVPFEFECDKSSGLIMDPNMHKRIGFITEFDGVGLTLPLKKDLQARLPFKTIFPGLNYIQMVNGQPTTSVVGVLENFAWNGGVGDPIKLEFWVSQESMTSLKAVMSAALKTNTISAIDWWIGDYDQETKTWYEAAKPSRGALKGTIQGGTGNPVINVDAAPAPTKGLSGEVALYKVVLEMVPRPNEPNTLVFANSSAKPMTKTWGLQVGTLAPNPLATPH